MKNNNNNNRNNILYISNSVIISGILMYMLCKEHRASIDIVFLCLGIVLTCIQYKLYRDNKKKNIK